LQSGRNESAKLSDYGILDVQSIKTYKGLLIVVGDRSVLLYDLHQIHQPLFHFQPPDGRLVRGVTFVEGDGEEVLVTTSRGVYRLDLLTTPPATATVYEAAVGRYITHPVASCAKQLYALELDESAQCSRLIRLPDQEVLTFDGVGHSLVRLTGERLFFSTRDRAFLFADGKVLEQSLPDSLTDTEAAYSQAQEMIYLVGESGLWRIRVSSAELAPVNLPTRLLGAPRLAAQGDNVFIAHSQGFLVLDPFGGLRWDSTQQYIRAESDGLNPQVTENYVLFTALGQNGGSDLRIHAVNNLNDYKPLVYEQRLLCPPLLTNGRLFGAVGGTGTAVLNSST
jgi:hypothetical protein